MGLGKTIIGDPLAPKSYLRTNHICKPLPGQWAHSVFPPICSEVNVLQQKVHELFFHLPVFPPRHSSHPWRLDGFAPSAQSELVSRFSAQIYNKPCLHAINVARRFNAVGCAGPAYAETSHSPCELAVLIMRSIHFASSKLPLWKVQNFENISVHDQPFSHQMIFQQVDFVRESKPRAWIGLEASGLSQGPC